MFNKPLASDKILLRHVVFHNGLYETLFSQRYALKGLRMTLNQSYCSGIWIRSEELEPGDCWVNAAGYGA